MALRNPTVHNICFQIQGSMCVSKFSLRRIRSNHEFVSVGSKTDDDMADDQPQNNGSDQSHSNAAQAPRHDPNDGLRRDVVPTDEQKNYNTDNDGQCLTGPQHIEGGARQNADQ